MDLKKIVNEAFQETYRPLTDWQRFVIEEAVDFVNRIDSEDGFACSLNDGFGSPISYREYTSGGENKNTASVEINITFQNQTVRLGIEFTETFRNSKREAKCSLGGYGRLFEDKTEFSLSDSEVMTKLLGAVAQECGRKMANAKMERQLKDAIAAQRLINIPQR